MLQRPAQLDCEQHGLLVATSAACYWLDLPYPPFQTAREK
jgi:hypothetical protein